MPFAVVGALFAGVVLARRDHPRHGAGVAALGVVCAVVWVLATRKL